jgi:hypothetical protein
VAKPLIPIGTAKVECLGTYGPATWANVFYVVIDAGASTPGAVIAQIVSWFHDFYAVAIDELAFTDGWIKTHTVVTYRDAEDSIVRLRVADAIAGTGGTDLETAQVAYLINWATGDIRRGGKPRQYLCGVNQTHLLDSARLTTTIQAAVNARLITWLEDGPDLPIPLQLVEMSFRNAKADRADAVTFPIIGGTLNNVVATQKRRVGRLRN